MTKGICDCLDPLLLLALKFTEEPVVAGVEDFVGVEKFNVFLTNETLNMEINAVDAQVVDIVVSSIDGKIVSVDNSTELVSGNNNIQNDLPSLSSGIYVVSIRNANVVATQKLFLR